ncbi:Actin cross-linking [Cynara cardunculus var. scolymus]|uniref:Actin cross-linking n=1 Tax=Cynara cardunculus var. scolymus TaxID=59895 RepID=A0A103XSL7_CYNCS|nr:Actin cross-linking [Cynara cardunculus var. scolymus]
MEFFEKAVAVRLKSSLDKYLVAGDDHETVRQSSSASATRAAGWLIEHVESNGHVIRLKSCYGRYLTATNTPLLFGMTGNKVIQSVAENTKDLSIEWQPVRDGFQFKLKSSGGTYLRANGAMPPWRNTVTHDGSFTSATNSCILWDVEAIDIPDDEEDNNDRNLSIVSSYSSASGELSGRELGSPISVHSSRFSPRSPTLSMMKKLPLFRLKFSMKLIKPRRLVEESGPPVVELLRNTKTVRLRSRHGKFLHADYDQESVSQDRHGTTKNNYWSIEFVENTPDNVTIIRLKSCYGKYLTASNHPFLLGLTGKKVLQTVPSRLDSSVEWEPLGRGKQVKLKTRYGHYLRANGGLPPWRNSVTHDIPHRTATQDWIMWQIDITVQSPPAPRLPLQLVPYADSFTSSEPGSPSTNWSKSPTFSNQESIDSPLKREEGRAIYYHVVSDDFEDSDEDEHGFCISFKGNRVNELTRKLEEETRLHNITVCSPSPLDGKLYPLQLELPPNNFTMKVVVVPNSSQGERQLRIKG